MVRISSLTMTIAVQQICKYISGFVWFSTLLLLSSLFCFSAPTQKALEMMAVEHKAEAMQNYSPSSPHLFIY